MRKTGVRFQPAKKGKPDVIVFSFVQLVGLYIISPFEVVIPVPGGGAENCIGSGHCVGRETSRRAV